jgi:peptidoglycan/LPS O-acetylase OafA/YrhL
MPVTGSAPVPKPKLEALTGLRFFAAFQVLMFHTVKPWLSLRHDVPLWILNLFGSGYIGVNFFFLLSGFILAYNYLDEKGERRCTKQEFWAARFARVYPVYLFCLFLAIPLFIGQVGSQFPGAAGRTVATIAGVFASLFLVQAWIPSSRLYVNPPGWSLANEAVFYALFPLLAKLVRPLKVRGLLIAAFGIWMASLFFPLVYLSILPDGAGPVSPASEGVWISVLKFNPLIHVSEFLFGMVTGRIYLSRRHRPFNSSAIVSCGAAIAVLLLLAFSSSISYPVLHNGLLSPLFALLIYSLAYGKGPVAYFVSLPGVVLLGEASYSLYLLHFPANIYLVRLAWAIKVPVLIKTIIIVSPLLIIVCSIVVFKMVEHPARQALRRWFKNSHFKRDAFQGKVAGTLKP